MLRFYLVRHGETDWNQEKRYLGHTDLALNKRGEEEALKLKSDLAKVSFETCYSSDLQRARETAKIAIGGGDVPLKTETALRELNFGIWEGLTYEEIQQRYPEELQTWIDSQGRTSPFKGEDLGDLEVRVAMWLNTLIGANVQGNVLVVSHGGPLRVLLCLLLGISTGKHWQFQLQTGGVAVVEVHDGQGILQALYTP